MLYVYCHCLMLTIQEESSRPLHPLAMVYENKKSFKTGDPANSGFSKTQLKISQSLSLA